MGLRKCSCDGLLQVHVLWVDYILSIPAYQARDTGRRLVSEPLPDVTSCRPSALQCTGQGLLPYPRSVPRPCAYFAHLVP
jgi:hypothetical protein